MMGRFNRYISMLILIFGSLLSACQPSGKNTENNMNNQPYILHFGKTGIQDFIKYGNAQVDRQPAGASFRDLSFSPPNLAQIKIENGVNSLVIEHVFSILGTQFDQNEGIQILDIDAGLNKEELVTPEQAYQGYVELMKRMNQAGWRGYFRRYNSRISKEDNIKYLEEWNDVIDPSYIFSFDEWKKVFNLSSTKSLGYRLYAKGILLDISLKQTEKSPQGKEQYMLRYSFQTIRYDERNTISNSDKMTPQELEQAFKQSLIRDQQSREIEEKQAIAKGYRIDKTYVDPDVWPYVK